MQKITCVDELNEAILLLEMDHSMNRNLLDAQCRLILESLKPVSILRGALKDVASSPGLVDNIIGTAAGLATGYLTKLIVVNTSGNLFRKLFGLVLQLGVTNVVAKNPDAIKFFAGNILRKVLPPKENN